MIGFELTQAQQQWREKAREFTEKEIKPLAWNMDKGLTEGYHWPLIRKMSGQGLLSLAVPVQYGGSGLDILTTCMVVEELAVGDGGIAFTSSLNSFVPLMVAGTEEQKSRFLPLTCGGENPGLSGFALTEPGAGSDAGSLTTSARKEGQEYVLSGEKCFISNGDVAALYTVFATVDRSKGVRGITAFVVPGDAPGISRGKIEDKMGFHSSHTGVVALHDVRIPEGNRLGAEGEGFRIAMQVLEVLRVISCGAVGIGIARAAYETAHRFLTTHSNAKTVMGQQAVAFQMADMLASIEAARLMVWKTSWLLDTGRSASTLSALTKFYASDMAVEVSSRAMQLVGPHAYCEEYPLEKLVRDAKLLQIYEGTNEIARLVASRAVFSG